MGPRVHGPVPTPFNLPRDPRQSSNFISNWTPTSPPQLRQKQARALTTILKRKLAFHVQDAAALERFQKPQLALLARVTPKQCQDPTFGLEETFLLQCMLVFVQKWLRKRMWTCPRVWGLPVWILAGVPRADMGHRTWPLVASPGLVFLNRKTNLNGGLRGPQKLTKVKEGLSPERSLEQGGSDAPRLPHIGLPPKGGLSELCMSSL